MQKRNGEFLRVPQALLKQSLNIDPAIKLHQWDIIIDITQRELETFHIDPDVSDLDINRSHFSENKIHSFANVHGSSFSREKIDFKVFIAQQFTRGLGVHTTLREGILKSGEKSFIPMDLGLILGPITLYESLMVSSTGESLAADYRTLMDGHFPLEIIMRGYTPQSDILKKWYDCYQTRNVYIPTEQCPINRLTLQPTNYQTDILSRFQISRKNQAEFLLGANIERGKLLEQLVRVYSADGAIYGPQIRNLLEKMGYEIKLWPI